MGVYYRLERKYGHLGIPGLVRILAVFRGLTWLLSITSPGFDRLLIFDRGAILSGQVWRVITFLFTGLGGTGTTAMLFVLIMIFFMFFISDGLERAWGPFGVTLYVVGSVFAGALVGLLVPAGPILGVVVPSEGLPISSEVVYFSLIMAFACLYPDVQILLFLIIPVKIKYIGMLTGAFLLFGVAGGFVDGLVVGILRALPTFGLLLPFLLVFAPAFYRSMKARGEATARRHRFEQRKLPEKEAFHQCASCGATEISHAGREFRVTDNGEEYCSDCLAKRKESA